MNTNAVLWYDSPAKDFNSALPIGNGRIGGMVYGKITEELININEDSVWSGSKRNRINPDAGKSLNKIREFLFKGKVREAEELAMKSMAGTGIESRHYMPLGDLYINMKNMKKPNNYSRKLDLTNSICTTEFEFDDINFKREVFTSHPDNVLVVHITTNTPGSICLSARLDRINNLYDDNRPINVNTLMLTGGNGIFFTTVLSATAKGGMIYTLGGNINIECADEATLILGVRTSYYTENHSEIALNDVNKALKMDYSTLKSRHIEDYQSLFNRVSFDLCDNSEGASERTTDKRLKRLRANGYGEADQGSVEYDNKLIELFFNYSRYLMISASREGTLPMNMQGIWNIDINPKWGSRHCTNINMQMNYWAVDSCNLFECHTPLFDHIEKIRQNGRQTAKEMYNCNGFMCHHNTDIWGDTEPQDQYPPATIWQMGAAWLCLSIFEHYEYTQDINFLSEKYDTLKEAAQFIVDFLIEDKNGMLVTCPSVSPENSYITDSGVKAAMCIAPTIDSQIITALFNAVIKSSEILNRNLDFASKLKEMLPKLPKTEIGKYGQIKEWLEDYDEAEAGHRHISQLFALYPGNAITPYETPALAKAARATLIRRLVHGGGHTGWSRAWIVNFWARLHDGEMVFENLQKLLSKSVNNNMMCSHPPFQIDGNFGGAAGIIEALVQSHRGEIELLPALPIEWKSGEIKGICVRGGFEINIKWNNNKPVLVEIISKCGNLCQLREKNEVVIKSEGKIIPVTKSNEIISFNTQLGKSYVVDYGSYS